MVKVEIPVHPPQGADYPTYLPWFFSNVLLPCPLYIITTVDGKGVPNAQPNSWGLPYGAGDVPMFLFSCWTTHHTYENVLETGEFVVNVPGAALVDVAMEVNNVRLDGLLVEPGSPSLPYVLIADPVYRDRQTPDIFVDVEIIRAAVKTARLLVLLQGGELEAGR